MKVITIIIIFIVLVPVMAHAIHISYGEGKLKDNIFTVKVTFNKPDFMQALRNKKGSPLINYTNKEFDELKKSYLSEHLFLSNNEYKRLATEIIGNQEDDASIWFIIRFISPAKIISINMHYDVLVNEYGDQMNLLNIKTESGNLSKIFSKTTKDIKIKF
jgi:hypothetical protein